MWSHGIKHHQKINRVARKKLGLLTSLNHFPRTKLLDYFEGEKGPDGIKYKSPGHNEPYHFYDPFDDEDTAIMDEIKNHFDHLVEHLSHDEEERTAFEASWLAHTLVDGLTPAHHSYESELRNLGSSNAKTKTGMISIAGETPGEKLKNSWKVYGAKGALTSHSMFEGGVAAISAPMTFSNVKITKHDVNEAKKLGLDNFFMMMAREIAILSIYDRFQTQGWTTRLARDVRDELMPRIIKVVVIAWYLALNDAGLTGRPASKS